jgi:hypothetical protein
MVPDSEQLKSVVKISPVYVDGCAGGKPIEQPTPTKPLPVAGASKTQSGQCDLISGLSFDATPV